MPVGWCDLSPDESDRPEMSAGRAVRSAAGDERGE